MMSHLQSNSCLWRQRIIVLVSKMSEGHFAVLWQRAITHTVPCADAVKPTLAVALTCFTYSEWLKELYSVTPRYVYMYTKWIHCQYCKHCQISRSQTMWWWATKVCTKPVQNVLASNEIPTKSNLSWGVINQAEMVLKWRPKPWHKRPRFELRLKSHIILCHSTCCNL